MTSHSLKNYLGKRGAALLLLTAIGAAFAGGCGGGGGNGNTTILGGGTTGTGTGSGTGTSTGTGTGTGGITPGNASIVGKVVIANGDPVPAATIIPDTGGLISTTVSQGSYRMDGLTGDVVHRLNASATVNNVNYTGSTQVLTLSGNLLSNVNILLSQQGQQATLTGRITDPTRLNPDGTPTPIYQARVFLAVPNNANYSSLVAFTDSNGVYTIPNIPVSLPTVQAIQVSASLAGYSNSSSPLTGIQAGGTYRQDFSLTPSTNQSVNTPTLLAVTTSTQPSDALAGSALQAHTASAGSVYEQIRRRISPAYARLSQGHLAARTKRYSAHLSGGFGSYAIETDVAFDNTAQNGSVLAYTVYRTVGTTLPAQSLTPYDVLQDPLANYYSDIDPSYQPYSQYNFALSATNTDRTETPLSLPLSVTPLGQLTLTQPATGQTLANNVAIFWTQVSGATSYYVFIYSQYPSINVNPVATSTALLAPAGNYTLPGALPSGRDYYVVVVGAADQTEGTDGNLLPVKVTNAVTTFSPITRFHVP